MSTYLPPEAMGRWQGDSDLETCGPTPPGLTSAPILNPSCKVAPTVGQLPATRPHSPPGAALLAPDAGPPAAHLPRAGPVALHCSPSLRPWHRQGVEKHCWGCRLSLLQTQPAGCRALGELLGVPGCPTGPHQTSNCPCRWPHGQAPQFLSPGWQLHGLGLTERAGPHPLLHPLPCTAQGSRTGQLPTQPCPAVGCHWAKSTRCLQKVNPEAWGLDSAPSWTPKAWGPLRR